MLDILAMVIVTIILLTSAALSVLTGVLGTDAMGDAFNIYLTASSGPLGLVIGYYFGKNGKTPTYYK